MAWRVGCDSRVNIIHTLAVSYVMDEGEGKQMARWEGSGERRAKERRRIKEEEVGERKDIGVNEGAGYR